MIRYVIKKLFEIFHKTVRYLLARATTPSVAEGLEIILILIVFLYSVEFSYPIKSGILFILLKIVVVKAD